jgi:hypothetical protein
VDFEFVSRFFIILLQEFVVLSISERSMVYLPFKRLMALFI